MRIAISENMAERIPRDLALMILLTLACIPFVLVPPLNETPVRIILGLLLVLFLPGYSLIAALFPRKDDLDGIERIALSFGLSIAVVPLLGLALNYTPVGIRLVPVLVVLSVFTVLLAVIAGVRRQGLPEGERFVVEGWGFKEAVTSYGVTGDSAKELCASSYNRSSVAFDAKFRRLLVKQAPAGYCICEKQHRAGSNQNRANTTWWNSPASSEDF